MKICGITAEYNPLHNGHIYHIEKTREISGCDILVAVMSGNFVQRGEPAVVNKWMRAASAVRNGVDAVIELPYLYSVQSASRFAHGAASLLKLAGVSCISFGSECGNAENLKEIASTSINPDYLRESMHSGMSYPKAYSLLTSQMEPNDILAVCYLKEIAGTEIEPIVIQRSGGYHEKEIHPLASAMAIRQAIEENRDYSGTTPMEDELKTSYHAFSADYYPYLRAFLLSAGRQRLQQLFLFSEGIEKHLIRCAGEESTWEGFLAAASTYRYTASRIRRTCLQALNQITKEEAASFKEPDTLRILAFNERGRSWLKEMKNRNVKTAVRFADLPPVQREIEYRTTLMYTSVMPEEIRKEILANEIQGARYIR